MEWDERRLIDILEICDSGTWGEGEANPKTGYPVLRSNNIQDWKLDLSVDVAYRKVTQRDVHRYRLANGDIIVTRSSGSAHLIGKCALFDLEPADGIFLFSNFTQRLRPNRAAILPKYLFFYLRSPQARDAIDRMHTTTSGLRNLRIREYKLQPIPLPPLDEQRRIVACIEELTERIDAARRLRAEAAEEVAAILPSALAEVFGEAEARGWETRWLSEVADINMGQSPPGSSYNQEGIGLPLVGGASDLGEVYPSASKWTSQPSKTSRPGDIIICVRATIGDLNWADKEYCLGRGVAGLTPKQGIEPGFLFHYLRSQHAELNARGTGSTFKQISKSTLVELPVPLPPLDEQRRIVEYLDAMQAKVEAVRRYQEETQQEIEAMTGAVLEMVFRGEL